MLLQSKLSRFPRLQSISMRIAVLYGVAGAVWILAADGMILIPGLSPDRFYAAETFKGLSLVAVTALGLYALLRKQVEPLIAAREAMTQARERLIRLNRIHDMSSAINRIILQERDTEILLEKACGIAANQGGFCLAWVGMRGAAPNRVEVAANAGAGDAYLARLGHVLEEGLRAHGPTATAFQSGQPVVVNHIATDPLMACCREAALAAGLGSSVAFPLLVEEEIRGTLNLYRAEAAPFMEDELALLGALTLDLAFALETAQRNEDRRRMDQALQSSERRFRLILDNMHEGYQILGFDWRYRYLNEAALRHGRRRREELLGHRIMECYPGIENTPVFAVMRRAMEERAVESIDNEFVYPDGARGWFELFFQPVEEGISILSQDIGKRRNAEMVLLQSEQRYHSLVEYASDAILVNLDDHVVLANRAALSLFGAAQENDLLGKSPYELFPPEWHDQVRSRIAVLRERGEAVSPMEEQILRLDGAVVDVEVSAAPFRYDGKNAIHVILRDITKRKLAEAQLETERARAAGIVESAMDGIISMGEDHRVLLFNGSAQAMFGYTETEILGQPLECLMPKRYRSGHAEHVRKFAMTGVSSRSMGKLGTIYGLRRDGEEFPIEASISQTLLQGRQVFTVILRDVSEQKRAHDELLEARRRLERTVSAGHVGLWEWNLETDEVYFSPEWKRQLGFDDSEVANHFSEWPARLHPDDYVQAMQIVDAYISNPEGAYAQEFRMRHKDGSFRWILAQGSIVHEGGGRARRLMGTHIDITERKRLEEQFFQAQKMESVGRLAGGVAHDFNNLLTGILGYTEFALNNLDHNHPIHDDLLQIYQAAERATALTSQLLAFSRKQVLKPQVLDLNELIQELQKMIGRLISEDIALIFIPGSNLGRVRIDPSQMEQVILNLVVNARDAMPNGGRLVLQTSNEELDADYVRMHGLVSLGTYVLLSVSDSGCGMNSGTLQCIFDPFYTTKEQGKGTGLGLATVQGIVQQSGGHIFVYSEEGTGSAFKIYLPHVDAPAEARTSASHIPVPGTECILLVEDDALLRLLTERMLKTAGYEVHTATNGNAALELMQDATLVIDLVLTDLVMPGIGGRELADRLQRLRPGLKVLYMSGYTDDTIIHQGVLAETMQFLGKPFTIGSLTQKVRETLDAE
ncbi:MAG: PAS domain S-box protein [Candidatus Hydrogenedentes bacterium]|nr:PAS domain S-box protein [Candidatus Hydrogenedentota bacterium]